MFELYKKPEYYDMAFSLRNYEKEVCFLEKIFVKFSKIKVKTILDIGCGTGSHAIEFANYGYNAFGLDSSEKMINFARRKVRTGPADVHFFVANMSNFRLPKKVDACISMFNSFASLLENQQILSHLDCVADVLHKGGLYIVELSNPYPCWITQQVRKKQRCRLGAWVAKCSDTNIKTEVWHEPFDVKTQIEWGGELRLLVEKNKKTFKIIHREPSRVVFPQEFTAWVESNKNFRLLKWYGGFNFSKLNKNSLQMIAVLKRI